VKTLEQAEKLSPNQQRALVALLATPTIKAAAKEVGLGESTVRSYLQQPAFRAAYNLERSRMLAESVAELQQTVSDATAVFVQSLDHHDRELALRAARSVWEYALRGIESERKLRELEELEERIQVLEQQHARRGNGWAA
jgi:flagellar motility protein MotE (MotC chaperone)